MMSGTVMAVFSNGYSLHPSKQVPSSFHRRPPKQPGCFGVPPFMAFSDNARAKQSSAFQFFRRSAFRIRSFQNEDGENIGAAEPIDKVKKGERAADEVLENQNSGIAGRGSSFLAKLAIALGVAAALTVVSFGHKRASFGSLLGVQRLAEGSSSSIMDSSVGFTFKAFGYRFILPEYAPGWIYFWLLMAAGCGLFISEEALNIWVCPLHRLA